MPASTSQRVYALDALRGLAAVAVVLFHYTLFTPQADLGFKYGVTGVDIFFLFSGFVVLISFKPGSTIKKLIVNRVARLYPAYWSAVLFTGFLFWYYNVHTSTELHEFLLTLGANLTMFQYYLQRPNLDGPYWTMTYEVIFFLFMLFVFGVNGLKKIEWVALTGIMFTGIHNFLFKKYMPQVFTFFQLWLPILSHFALFMGGIIFYKIRTEGLNFKRFLIIALAYMIQLSSFDKGGMSRLYIHFNEYFVILTGYFVIMFLIVYDRLNILAIKPILFFGRISYPLFLVHQFVSRSVIIAVLMRYEHYGFWQACAIAFIFCTCLALLITKYIEKPLGNFIKTGLIKKNT